MRVDIAQDVMQREPGGVADQSTYFGQVWFTAVAQVFEILAVDPAVGNMNDLHSGIHQVPNPLGQFADRNPLSTPNIDRVPVRVVDGNESRERPHHVLHVSEAARLLSIAMNDDGTAGNRLPDKCRNHHAIGWVPDCRGPAVLNSLAESAGKARL